MVTPILLTAATASAVATGGTAVAAIIGPVLGGFIVNPLEAADQGLAVAEPLYVDLIAPAALGETSTTIPIYPGDLFEVPAGFSGTVWINAASDGHLFSAVALQSPTQFPPTPTGDTFPPDGPTTLLAVIKSYLYQQYTDDDDLQAFVDAYNTMVQQYVDWFNQINLPVYTGPNIVGALLDWVAQGLYGLTRPVLPSGRNRNIGPLNTWPLNTITYNTQKVIGPQNYNATSDDTFKRIMTWHLYRGDGRYFTIRWLKRRIMRFLEGENGTDPGVDQTYQISVTFGTGNIVSIRIISGVRTITGGAIFNRFALNTMAYNQINSTFTPLPSFPEATLFKAAVDAGALELPFQFEFVVSIT